MVQRPAMRLATAARARAVAQVVVSSQRTASQSSLHNHASHSCALQQNAPSSRSFAQQWLQPSTFSSRPMANPLRFTKGEGGDDEDSIEDRVIVITSGKGGVGKTTASANLGMSIARWGATWWQGLDEVHAISSSSSS